LNIILSEINFLSPEWIGAKVKIIFGQVLKSRKKIDLFLTDDGYY